MKIKFISTLFFVFSLFLIVLPTSVRAGGGPFTQLYLTHNEQGNALSLQPGINPMGVIISTAGTAGSVQQFVLKGVNGPASFGKPIYHTLNLFFDTLGPVSGIEVNTAIEIVNGDGRKYLVSFTPLPLDSQVGWQQFSTSLSRSVGLLPATLQNASIRLYVWNVTGSAPSAIETNAPFGSNSPVSSIGVPVTIQTSNN